MRYWGILGGKLAVAGGALYAIWLAMHAMYTVPYELARFNLSPFPHDPKWTVLMMLYWLLCTGVAVAIVIDQRYRCSACGRRLRMPIRTGSYARTLLGPPKTEYICIYGHGTLRVQEGNVSGTQTANWEPHDDIWKELFQTSGKNDE